MSVQLAREDFNKLVTVLRASPGFANVRDRRRLVEAALEGVPRGADLLSQLDLDGAPQLVANVRLFGSVVRGEDTETSDVDFLVDRQEGRSLLDLVGLQQDLDQFLGQRIDVLTEWGLNRYLKDRILTEARPL